MILHTAVPYDKIFETNSVVVQTINTADGMLEGKMTANGFVVSRLISTNPGAYLDKRYTPGGIYK